MLSITLQACEMSALLASLKRIKATFSLKLHQANSPLYNLF